MLEPVIAGGTGSASDSEYLPEYLPDRFESGTPNLPGIYGWEAALRFVETVGVDALRKHEMKLCQRFLKGIEEIPGVRLCGTTDLSRRVGVISVDFLDRDNAEAAFELETDYGILTRCGLHMAHRSPALPLILRTRNDSSLSNGIFEKLKRTGVGPVRFFGSHFGEGERELGEV